MCEICERSLWGHVTVFHTGIGPHKDPVHCTVTALDSICTHTKTIFTVRYESICFFPPPSPLTNSDTAWKNHPINTEYRSGRLVFRRLNMHDGAILGAKTHNQDVSLYHPLHKTVALGYRPLFLTTKLPPIGIHCISASAHQLINCIQFTRAMGIHTHAGRNE